MGQGTPMELTKIKKIVAEIKEFPAKIDSTELAKSARHLLKKYAILSEKIERNILITAAHQKELAKIRTEEFKAIRRALKEKANLILHAKNNKNVLSEKPAKKTGKTPAPKKATKAADESVAKETSTKKTVKKASPKPKKATAPKEGA
jgi:glucan-binding YG repeat protein